MDQAGLRQKIAPPPGPWRKFNNYPLLCITFSNIRKIIIHQEEGLSSYPARGHPTSETMRNNIVSPGADELKYEIREIVALPRSSASSVSTSSGRTSATPFRKGEKIPDWIKEIVIEANREDSSYAYSPTKGLEATREFLARMANTNGKCPDHERRHHFLQRPGRRHQQDLRPAQKRIPRHRPEPGLQHPLLGRGLACRRRVHIVQSGPAQPLVSRPERPRMKVKYNPAISGHPCHQPRQSDRRRIPEGVLQEIVAIAQEYDLFIVCDEIYINMAYNGKKAVPLAEVIGDVCGISMKGISKELPWPGSRCGWIEVYNQTNDAVSSPNTSKASWTTRCSRSAPPPCRRK